MAIPYGMASTMVKSTFTLDVETAERLERLARAWGVSKSEVLRRAIRAAPDLPAEVPHPALASFERLQAARKRSAVSAQQWARDAREQRRSASANREPTGGPAR
jgi:predicted transcriptional regulator